MTYLTQPFTLLPFREPGFYVLLSLATGEQDGFSLLKTVEDLSGGDLRPGAVALYASLSRLVGDGWIERLDPVAPHTLARYRLTLSGSQAIQAETARLARAARVSHV